MAWIATNEEGETYLFEEKPIRSVKNGIWYCDKGSCPYLSTRIVGLLTNENYPKWEDEPVQIGIIDGE